jgi:hypothetical protein
LPGGASDRLRGAVLPRLRARIALRGFGTEMFAAPAAGAATGAHAVLAPGATAPLSVSWSGRAVAVEVEGSRLALH